MRNFCSEVLDEHLIHYVHPILNPKTSKIEFLEILSRLNYKGKIFEPSHFLKDITASQKYILAVKGLSKLKEFQKKYPELSFSINISTIEMEEGLIQLLKKISEDKDIDPKRCVIEILETSSICPLVQKELENLKKNYGYKFALDDFGAGYSNLKQMFVSNGLFKYIKVDGSLVKEIDTNSAKKLALSAMVLAIQANKKQTIVEYISDNSILDAMHDVSADFLQGFVYCKPMLMDEFVLKHLYKKSYFAMEGENVLS